MNTEIKDRVTLTGHILPSGRLRALGQEMNPPNGNLTIHRDPRPAV
jgi:hypothetical protein